MVFGGADVGTSGTVELSSLNGSDGFRIDGFDEFSFDSLEVSEAGDVNDDGVDDLIIGAPDADPNGIQNAGESHVLFGGVGIGADGVVDVSSLNGANGFTIDGIAEGDFSGLSVSGAGDVNGDGVDDLIIGRTYLIFGGADVGIDGTVELSALDGINGFAITSREGGCAGCAVSGAGDVNGDGVDDVIIGARFFGGVNNTFGKSYVVFGRNRAPRCNGLAVTVDLNRGETPGSGPDVILGTPGDDDIRGFGGDDTICGMGGDDSIRGNDGDDWISGGAGVDDLRGGAGFDILLTGRGATVGTTSRVLGGPGDDYIVGGLDADFLRGGPGEDFIIGNGGADLIYGDADADSLYGGPGADRIVGGKGGDELFGGPGADVLLGGPENDDLFGERGNDTLYGGPGSDSCDGGGQAGDTAGNC